MEVFLQSAVGIVPWPEVVHLPANLFRPSSRGVRKEREGGVGLARFLGASRITGHGEHLLQHGCHCDCGEGGYDALAAHTVSGVNSGVKWRNVDSGPSR